jgi:hypothetical protein
MFVGIDVSNLKFDACCLFDDRKRTKIFNNNIRPLSKRH